MTCRPRLCRRTLALLATALCALARANDVPAVYPTQFDHKHASTAIVVARPTEVADLPPFPGCEGLAVMPCHWPFRFRADIIATLAGRVPETPLNVASESHSGQYGFAHANEPRLFVLETRSGQAIMPHDRSIRLEVRRDGELFIVLYGQTLPGWLPCGAADLAEAIAAADFPSDIGLDMDAADDPDDPVARHPDIWRIDGRRAFPRNGVRIARLADFMHGLATRGEPMDCPRPR
jgi:hypothetical protein